MNARETMAFKAMLKRIAAEENVPAQVVLQNYMFERLPMPVPYSPDC